MRQLNNAGIRAEIARVDFRFDPEQDYVVVDIETTGSWSNGDRITEIGAVKLRNHEVVGEWHSLIDPQRSIPANITRLTGINSDMVQGAPVFVEIADSFMQFMGEGIFVAHSVNFDYGFISYEYERLERRFRFPKLVPARECGDAIPAINPTVLAIFARRTAFWKTIMALSATQQQRRGFSTLSISNVMGGPRRAALPRKHDQ